MRRNFLGHSALVIAVLVAAAPATAATYTSQASFLAANPGATLTSFTGLSTNLDQLSNPVTVGPLTISGVSPYATSTNFWGSVDSIHDNQFDGFLNISFAPTTAIGFFLANGDFTGFSPTITFKNGATTVFTAAPVAGGVFDAFSYFGVDGIGSFDSVNIAAGNTNAFVSIGEVSLGGGNVAVVPEPASWAMLIAGFGLTGAMMRRRRIARAA